MIAFCAYQPDEIYFTDEKKEQGAAKRAVVHNILGVLRVSGCLTTKSTLNHVEKNLTTKEDPIRSKQAERMSGSKLRRISHV